MTHRLLVALIVGLLVTAPTSVWAQDDEEGTDLDALMSSDPERVESEPDEDDEGEDGDGAGEEGEGLDNSMVDEERPPGDPTAFRDPTKDEAPADDADGDGGNPFGIGLLLGYGLNVDGEVNPWSLGFGLRAGYDVGLVNVGVRFVYYIGESVSVPQFDTFNNLLGEEEVTQNLWEIGADIGFDIDLGDGLIRPGLGLGFASVSVGDNSEVAPYFAPGVAALYNLSETFFIGLDVRFMLVAAESSESGLIFLPTFGVSF